MLFTWGMIVEMIFGAPEMQVVMLGFGEVMYSPSRRYLSCYSCLPMNYINFMSLFYVASGFNGKCCYPNFGLTRVDQTGGLGDWPILTSVVLFFILHKTAITEPM